MTLAGIREGDIVRCDIRGDRFLAFVGNLDSDRMLEVHPLANGRGPLRLVSARQVIDHWRKSRRKARAA